MNYKKFNILIIACFFAGLFLYSLVMNNIYPLQSDDFAFISHNKNLSEIFLHAFTATKNEYLYWSGRIYYYFTLYLSLASLKFFNILNPLVFCAMIYGAMLNIKLRHPKNLMDFFTLLFIFIFTYLCVTSFSEVFFWKTGSAYLRVVAPTLFLIYPFLQLLENNKDIISGHPIKVVLIILAAFILGTAMENLSVAVCLLFIGVTFIYWYRNKKLPWAITATTISYILGSIILIAAPGNYIRAGILKSNLSSTHHLLPSIAQVWHAIKELHLWHFTKQIITHYTKSHHGSLPLIVLAAVALFVAIIIRLNGRKVNKRSFALLFLSFTCAFALIGVPAVINWPRTLLYSDLFFIMAMLAIISELDTIQYWKVIYAGVSIILLIVILPMITKNYTEIIFIQKQLAYRQQLIELFKQHKNETPYMQAIYVPSLKTNTYENFAIYSPRIVYDDISHGEQDVNWVLRNFQNYYGLTDVRLKPFVQIWPNLIANTSLASPSLAKTNQPFTVLNKNQFLFFINTQGSCASIVHKDKFFANIYPKNLSDLPRKQRKIGYDRLEFDWDSNHQVIILTDQGQIKQDVCVFATILPDYKIQNIEAGSV